MNPSATSAAAPEVLKGLLGFVERLGNRLPDLVICFAAAGIALTMVLALDLPLGPGASCYYTSSAEALR